MATVPVAEPGIFFRLLLVRPARRRLVMSLSLKSAHIRQVTLTIPSVDDNGGGQFEHAGSTLMEAGVVMRTVNVNELQRPKSKNVHEGKCLGEE
jgi:hypothetical protein